MTQSRTAELEQMLNARRRAIEGQVQQKIREFRDMARAGTMRSPAELSDEPASEDLVFALVEMDAQTLKRITAALARLRAGDYGSCRDCLEEISEKRLRALPFATTCLSCQRSAEEIQRRGRRTSQHRADVGPRPMMDTVGL